MAPQGLERSGQGLEASESQGVGIREKGSCFINFKW